MRTGLRLVCVASAIAGGLAQSTDQWSPAGPGDVRGPCPMLNALANHGYLAHNGQNITQNMTTMALDQALNIPPSFGTFLHTAAVRTNPEGNSTNTFSLDDLGRHNILEHDASLSRQDAFFGNNLEFNETVFDQTRSHWQETIDVPQAAAARLSRIQTSNMTNPTFGFTRVGMAFSVGESAAYIIVLGNSTSQTANRTVVEYLFQNEKLPTEVGWSRPAEPLGADSLSKVSGAILNATANATGATAQQVKRMMTYDLHASAARDFLDELIGLEVE